MADLVFFYKGQTSKFDSRYQTETEKIKSTTRPNFLSQADKHQVYKIDDSLNKIQQLRKIVNAQGNPLVRRINLDASGLDEDTSIWDTQSYNKPLEKLQKNHESLKSHSRSHKSPR